MSIQPAPSPFERVPEELLVMIQEEVLIKNEPDEGSEQTADATSNFFHPSRWYREGGFSMLKNLRMACREYTYLPRLLSDLFKTTRLVSTPPNLRLHQMTDLSVFKTYVRRVVSDPRTYASVIGLEIGTAELQSAWTEILLQLSNVEDALFSAILATLSTAGSNVRHLYLTNDTAHHFGWAADDQLERINLSNLQTLVFNPTIEISSHAQDVDTSYSSKALRTILKRCAHSIEYLSIGAACPIYWPHGPQGLLPTCHDYESFTSANLDIYILAPLRPLCVFAASLRTSRPSLQKVTLTRPKRLPGSGWWTHVWRPIREHPRRMQVELRDLEGLGGWKITFSHFTGDQCRYPRYDGLGGKSLQYALANHLYGVDGLEDDCHMFDIAGGEAAWETSDEEGKSSE